MDKKIIYSGIISIFLLTVIIGSYLSGGWKINPFINPESSSAVKKAVEFIKSQIPQGRKFSLDKVKYEDGLYHLYASIDDKKFELYLSSSGNLLFTQFIPLNEISKEKPKQKSNTISKKDKPDVLLFTMAFCPYGNQAEEAIFPAIELLENYINFQPHYVIYEKYMDPKKFCFTDEGNYCSMHGKGELNQDIRELCVFKYQKDKYWEFVKDVNKNCNPSNVDNCWLNSAKRVNLNIDKVKSCFEKEAEELLRQELDLCKKYDVRGSPALLINGSDYNGTRTPEAYKNGICSGFNNPPQECNKKLSDTNKGADGTCK